MMVYYNPYIIIGNPSLIKAYGGMTPSTPPPGTERLVTELVGWQARIWDSAGFFLRQNCLGFLVPFSKGYGLKTSPNMTQLGGGFRFFFSSPIWGRWTHFDSYFSNGLKPPTSWDVIEDSLLFFGDVLGFGDFCWWFMGCFWNGVWLVGVQIYCFCWMILSCFLYYVQSSTPLASEGFHDKTSTHLNRHEIGPLLGIGALRT